MSFYSDMERVISEYGDAGLDHLEHYYGLKLSLYRPEKSDVYSRTHGHTAGSPEILIKNFVGVVEGDDFFPSTDGFSGSFQAGFLYSRDKEVKVGDIVSINEKDHKVRRYKIVSRLQLGLTREIFTKWKLSSLGD